ncbi:MAG: hypothetical protein CMD33_05105 [Flavobacteriales bacterium]|nr:hypothetical protein [Flavobacteriales bacterium]
MNKCIAILMLVCPLFCTAQLIPEDSPYNEGIVWESVFTQGPEGKVNRGLVDSEGHAVCVSMPEGAARIHKVNGEDGSLIWDVTFDDRLGFGITEITGADGEPDYVLTGGAGTTQECWLARIDGSDGGLVWETILDQPGNNWEFDGLRSSTVGEDGYIYASGFTGGDEPNTVFVVFAGVETVLKADPDNGEIEWNSLLLASEYGLATVQDSNGDLYTAGVMYDEGWCITKRTSAGEVLWTEFIEATTEIYPYDLAIGNDDRLYYGGHRGREGAGDPFDYTCAALSTSGDLIWLQHYANPRGYSLSHIRNELYGIEVGTDGIYMFGGSGDESNYSETNQPFPSSDVWVGWVLHANWEGDILGSYVFCHEGVNSATEYGALIDGGFIIFNDTDAGGDTELGVMKIQNGSNPPVPTGTAEVEEVGFEISPNPNSGHFRVTGLTHGEQTSVHVFDAKGQEVYSENTIATSAQIDLSRLSVGTYFVRISCDGYGTSRQTVIVEN